VEKADYDAVKYISALAFTAWLAIIWALSFKYWQTAYELNYLFRMEDENRKKK